ncbi:uncharacterized protein LOC118565005 [Fundulus heteroclitus]|uniref:uncharacterized protein LOC118565005 n=1 Tax=Fundulus heteroclitus TaxID=8078 RepID=UPI00165B8D61|nr:uncharacterized protein LOC118565005 [Fundulus heteroclitus]
MAGAFDQEFQDDAWGSAPWTSLGEQVEALMGFVETHEKLDKKTQSAWRQKVLGAVTAEEKRLEHSEPLGKYLVKQYAKSKKHLNDCIQRQKSVGLLHFGKRDQEKADRGVKSWEKLLVIWQGIKHLFETKEETAQSPPPYNINTTSSGLYPVLDVRGGELVVETLPIYSPSGDICLDNTQHPHTSFNAPPISLTPFKSCEPFLPRAARENSSQSVNRPSSPPTACQMTKAGPEEHALHAQEPGVRPPSRGCSSVSSEDTQPATGLNHVDLNKTGTRSPAVSTNVKFNNPRSLEPEVNVKNVTKRDLAGQLH